MMAIASLQNVHILDSSILSEPRLSVSSGHHGNQEREVSRTSSILQMWRELEDECLASRSHERFGGRLQNESGDALSLHQTQDNENRVGLEGLTDNENVSGSVGEDSVGSQTEQDDHNSMTSEQSQDLGGAERERVRQIFREWMNTGGNGLTSNGSSISSSPRAQLLGRTELERIRAVREWIQTACEQRDNCTNNREEQGAEFGSQIDVREGPILHQGEVPTENSRRDIRRLCGRQALLDLLENNERERQRELQVLQERCPVSTFGFRNRIQSVLRIRLLHSRPVEYNRTNSTAESELGILRQRNSVSGLREGFLSRLDSNVHVQGNDHSSCSYSQNVNMFRGSETQPGSLDELVDNEHEQVIPADEDSISGRSNYIENPHSGDEINGQEDAALVQDVDERNGQAATADGVSRRIFSEVNETTAWQAISSESFRHRDGEHFQIEKTCQAYSDYGDEELQLHSSSSYRDIVESSGINDPENEEDGQSEGNHDAIFELHDRSDYYDPHDLSPHSVDLEDQGSEFAHAMDPVTHGYEQESDHEDQPTVGGILPNEWNDESQQNGTSDNQSNEDIDQNILEEPLSHEGGISSTGRVGSYYHSDDNNTAHNIELRELSSRRRVSSLLHSGFRERLNRLIQSYVERQSHPRDGEPHEMRLQSSVVHDHELVNANQNEDSSDVDGHSDVLLSTPFINSHRNWEQEFHNTHLSRVVHQSPGTELEMINDMRIEMARLQQRLDNMQTMLETCMDKQLELQRSVRQEVSAALNRSSNSSEPAGDAISRAGSNWDCVRKGICCICHENNIDSLLYRCGHMCTCVNCASILVENKVKCPMCQAPVVEKRRFQPQQLVAMVVLMAMVLLMVAMAAAVAMAAKVLKSCTTKACNKKNTTKTNY